VDIKHHTPENNSKGYTRHDNNNHYCRKYLFYSKGVLPTEYSCVFFPDLPCYALQQMLEFHSQQQKLGNFV
jgi:hypothetical protein